MVLCGFQGDTLEIDEVEPEDFGVYQCSAMSVIQGKAVTRTFDIELTEKGKFSGIAMFLRGYAF